MVLNPLYEGELCESLWHRREALLAYGAPLAMIQGSTGLCRPFLGQSGAWTLLGHRKMPGPPYCFTFCSVQTVFGEYLAILLSFEQTLE